MPFIECHVKTGLTPEARRKLIKDLVQITHEAVGSDPKIINVILHEHAAENLSVSGRIGGESFDDTKKAA